MSDSLADMQYEYTKDILYRKDLNSDPFVQFQLWFNQITQFDPMGANAFTLSTVSNDGRPGGRVLLLKGLENDAFVFFTNYRSRKAHEMEEGDLVSMSFFWGPLERQVRIEGSVFKLSNQANDDYFRTRPRESQIGAHVSPQSSVIENRAFLEDRFTQLKSEFGNEEIPRPEHWGGYALKPDYFEFWQGRASRLHDRFVYTKSANDWKIERLAP